ncbi:MAG TPA: 30S ribosomal protein S16 [Trueperaceae bacterium]|nr:30S ribosomal protein S16 [Trueperaceae bacterium]
MVKIRLMRFGAKKNPHYRIVVVDSHKKRNGRYIESLGFYDPRKTVTEYLKIDAERAAHWLGLGAQPTLRAVRLLEESGVSVPAKVRAKRTKAYIESAKHKTAQEASA